MATVTVSPKYQLVIPKDLRRSLEVRPGQKFAVFLVDGVLEFVPANSPAELRGFLKGMDPGFEREERDRT